MKRSEERGMSETTHNEDRCLRLTSCKNEIMNVMVLQQRLQKTSITTVPMESVETPLHHVGLCYCTRLMCFIDSRPTHCFSAYLRIEGFTWGGNLVNACTCAWKWLNWIGRWGGMNSAGISNNCHTDLYIILNGAVTTLPYRAEILRTIGFFAM